MEWGPQRPHKGDPASVTGTGAGLRPGYAVPGPPVFPLHGGGGAGRGASTWCCRLGACVVAGPAGGPWGPFHGAASRRAVSPGATLRFRQAFGRFLGAECLEQVSFPRRFVGNEDIPMWRPFGRP